MKITKKYQLNLREPVSFSLPRCYRKRWKLSILLLVGFFSCILCFMANADGFLQLPRAQMVVYEPGQKALIGWDGTTEVMILSTDVYASEPVWVVELIPFPTLPENPVAGSFDSFNTIIDIINIRGIQPDGGDVNDDGNVDILDALMVAQYYVGLYHFLPHLAGGDVDSNGSVDIVDALMIAQSYVGLSPSGWQPSSSGIEILFSEEIGVHNLTGLHVTDAQALIDAARSLLEEKESEIDVSWDELRNLSEDYLSRGLEYWVIDLLELGISEKSRAPVIYTFQSENLYFPLKISSAATGTTIISLFTFSEAPLTILKDQDGHSPGLWTRECVRELYITPAELASIEPALASLFVDEAKVGFYQYGGYLQNLKTDFRAE